MSTLFDLQDAAAISRVVWIDDVFAHPLDEALKVEIRAQLHVLIDNGNQPKHGAFKGIKIGAPIEVIDKKIDAVLDDQDLNLPRMLSALTKQANQCGIHGGPDEDLSTAQVGELRNNLKNVSVCSYQKWKSQRSDILAKANNGTLFLVDREFLREGLSDELGDEIIADILKETPKSYCIMFTHKIGDDTADDLRSEISKKLDSVEGHEFGVMSKRSLGDGFSDVTGPFSRALRMSLLCRFCGDVAKETCKVMSEAALKAACELASFSVETIDSAIFENSLSEGSSEFDVVERILSVNQRIASQRARSIADNSFEQLQKIRRVRAVKGLKYRVPNCSTEPKLHSWRIAEVLDDGKYINALHTPLRCGDIFCHIKSNERYLLLGQPCDLVVRGGSGSDFGMRNDDEAKLVLLEDAHSKETKRESNFVINGIGKNGKSWIIKFREAFSVNLLVLDLAVYNSDGSVSWKLWQKEPVQLLPGWQKRFRAIEQLFNKRKIPGALSSLSHCDEKRKLSYYYENWSFSYPLRRIGRIRSPYSEAIQASYASFISRAALSHDFAKNLWGEESVEQSDQ